MVQERTYKKILFFYLKGKSKDESMFREQTNGKSSKISNILILCSSTHSICDV